MTAGLTPQRMADHRAAWANLAERAIEPSIFNDPDFALPAALHLPRRRRPRFLTAWDDDDPRRLIGLCCVAPPIPGLPLAAWLHPQATAAFPLLDASRAPEALACLLRQAEGLLRPGGLLVQGMPADGATLRLIEAEPAWSVARLERRGRAVVRRGPAVPAGKAGKEFRRQARRLAEQGTVTLRSAATAADVAAALESFLRLEAQGWKGRRGTALGQDRRRARFVRSMVAALGGRGCCRIDTLDVDGRPAAMGIVLRSGPNGYFWKTAFDETFARFSPGAHLAAAIGSRQAAEAGIAVTDSCAIPGHTMIDRLWPERMTVVDALVAPSRSLPRATRASLWIEQARRHLRGTAGRLAARWRRVRRK